MAADLLGLTSLPIVKMGSPDAYPVVARRADEGLHQVGLGQGGAQQPGALANYLFMGSDEGVERAAGLYSLVVETAKLNGLDPEA